MKLFPQKKQWKKWTLLSKVGYISFWLAILSILITVFIVFYNKYLENKKNETEKQMYENLIIEIKKVQPQFASEELKDSVRKAIVMSSFYPTSADEWYLRAFAEEVDENYELAIEYYKNAIRLDTNYIKAYNNIGLDYYILKNYDKAIEWYYKTLEIEPDFLMTYANMSVVYYEIQEYDKAIEWCKKLIEKAPNFIGAYGNMSFVLICKKEYKYAEQIARTGIALDSLEIWLKTNLAAALLFQGKYNEAKDIYQELISTPYKDVCLTDFDAFEKAGAIPENRKEDVARIKKILKGVDKPNKIRER